MRRILVPIITVAAMAAAATTATAGPVAAKPTTSSTVRSPGESLNPQPLPPRGSAASPPLAKPEVAQKTGIIIVGGKPAVPAMKKLDPSHGR